MMIVNLITYFNMNYWRPLLLYLITFEMIILSITILIHMNVIRCRPFIWIYR